MLKPLPKKNSFQRKCEEKLREEKNKKIITLKKSRTPELGTVDLCLTISSGEDPRDSVTRVASAA